MTVIRSRIAIYIYSILGAFSATLLLFVLVMRPPLNDFIYLAALLALTGLVSAAVGLISYRLGWWKRATGLKMSMTLGHVLAAALTLLNVWLTARLMFFNSHDLALAVLLLMFAGGISVAFGYFLSGSIAQTLKELAVGAVDISNGDFATRVSVQGGDEVAQLAQAFNVMAARLEQATAEAQKLDTARRNLVAWASHDLRTPLASLQVMIDTLADGMVDDRETVNRYLKQSQTEIARMGTLINDLFELAKIDAGEISPEYEPSSLSDLVSDSLSSFMARTSVKSITLEGSVAPDVDPVWMAPELIGRVLYNLLENAIRHTPDGGEITVTGRARDGQAVVVVEDSGEGISSEDLPHVFDRFYRGEKSRKRNDDRLRAGLGLTIARRLVEVHGGRIWAETDVGHGTRMYFSLPRERSAVAAASKSIVGKLKLAS